MWGVDSVFRQVETETTWTDIYFEQSHVNEVYQNLGAGDTLSTDAYIVKRDETTRGAYADGWKGDQWRGITVDVTGITFKIAMQDNLGTTYTSKTIAQATTDWPLNFSNWDQDAVTFVSTAAHTSWDIDVVIAGFLPSSPPASVTDVEPLTLMTGAGSSATSGTFDDARFFVMAAADLGLGYFGYGNDFIWINNTRVQLVTLNKDTGAGTWTPAATWADNAPVYADCNGSKVTKRGASQ